MLRITLIVPTRLAASRCAVMSGEAATRHSAAVAKHAACPSPDRSAVSAAFNTARRWLGVSSGGGGGGDIPAGT